MNSIRRHRSTVHQLPAVIAAGVGVLTAVALSSAASADPGERSSPSAPADAGSVDRYDAGSALLTPTCAGQFATIWGGFGDDTLFGTSGPDVIVGLEGNDTIWAGGGDDLVCGAEGSDRIYGEDGSDRLDGGPTAGDGPDLVNGGRGSDTLFGWDGNDILQGGPDDDVLRGEDGFDSANYGGASQGVRVNLTTGQANGAGSDDLFGIEDVTGSRFNDRLTGDPSSNFFWGATATTCCSAARATTCSTAKPAPTR